MLHKPEAGLTVQLGRGDMLANFTRCPVVYDLRAADVAAGGQGAPLVPAYHRAVTAKLPTRPIAIVNVGGVSNVTWIGRRNGDLIAFDTGPGNALIDDWMMRGTGSRMDNDGLTAGHGRVDEDVIRFYLSHSYFAAQPPKSLDRNSFSTDPVDHLSTEDGAATLAAFTAQAIAKSREHMPDEPELWIVSGGGRRNRTIMRMLAERVHYAVVPAEAVGIDGDSAEAEAWAYLAVRSVRGLPITFPGTTGVSRADERRRTRRSAGRAHALDVQTASGWASEFIIRLRCRRSAAAARGGALGLEPFEFALALAFTFAFALALFVALAILLELNDPLVEIRSDDFAEFVDLVFKEVVGARHDLVGDLYSSLHLHFDRHLGDRRSRDDAVQLAVDEQARRRAWRKEVKS